MNVFGRKSGQEEELERALRRSRPEPRDAFLDELVAKTSTAPADSHPRSRLGLSLAFAVVTVVVFAAFGGLGYAASTVTGAVSSTTTAVSKVLPGSESVTVTATASKSGTQQTAATASKPARQQTAATAQYGGNVIVCHVPPGKNKQPFTLSVNQSALGGHLGHGDTLGACRI